MTTIYADASCYHATLATVLRWHGCADPGLVLGSNASSHACREGTELRFGETYPALARACARGGYTCRRRPVRSPDSWAETLASLRRGVPVIALVDPFHLPYYWIDYQRTHSQHALILWAFDDSRGLVHLCDPSDLLRYDGTMSLTEVQGAWAAEDRGQAWIHVRRQEGADRRDRVALLAELATHARTLVVDGSQLSCAGLARHVLDHRTEYLDLTRRVGEPDARAGTDDRRRRSSHFLRGIWNFHHTLRWLARFVQAAADRCDSPALRPTVRPLEEAAQNWLVVRNLFIKHAMSAPARRPPLADIAARRLDRIAAIADEVSPRLLSAVDDARPSGEPVGRASSWA